MIEPTPFQSRVLLVPETFDVFLGGGRGGGKSYTLALLALRHVEQYRDNARVLYIRRTYAGLLDFEQITRELFGAAYGPGARYNAQAHVWRLPNGATLELGQLDHASAYGKFQGRSFTLLMADECGQHADSREIDMLRSNLRSKDVPCRTVIAANPGGVGHQWLARRYVFRGTPWVPQQDEETGREFVYAPSTLADNPHLDAGAYRRQLEAACATDPELLKAWLEGSWTVARGAYFAGVLDDTRNATDVWTH